MVTFRTTILLFLLAASAPQYAQTIISGGTISGTWDADGNPYVIGGNLVVDADDRLTLKPGVEVLFTGNYSFEVYGRLDARGTEEEKIMFSLQDTAGFAAGQTGWGGMAFLGFFTQQTENSYLDHCIVEYSAGNGITCLEYPNLVVSHTTVRNNRNTGIVLYEFSDITLQGLQVHHNGTGGLEAQFSAAHISDFVIEHNSGPGVAISGSSYGAEGLLMEQGIIANNQSTMPGGGLQVLMDAVVSLNGVNIHHNSSTLGGGVYLSWANVSMEDVQITFNQATKGGGVYCDPESDLAMTNCLLAANEAEQEGGALWVMDAGLEMVRSTVTANVAGTGGAIYHQSWFGVPATISSSILWGNIPDEVLAMNAGPEITWSDIAGGYAGVGNIDADPLFENAENGDYHLSWTDYPWANGSMSPCIDAGDPALTADPDGTTADMGAYPYHQETVTGTLESRPAEVQCYPNPTTGILNISSDERILRVSIYNLTGQMVLDRKVDSMTVTLDTGTVGSGVYIVILEGVGGSLSKVKLVRE